MFGDQDRVDFALVKDVEIGFFALEANMVDVLAGADYSLAADAARGYDFSPPYFYGSEGERVALATLQDATQWTEFVRWSMYALVHAEEQHIGSAKAAAMPTLDLFGAPYESMFRLLVLAVGNYGDLYERNLEALFPRNGFNTLNDGSTPLMMPIPMAMFG